MLDQPSSSNHPNAEVRARMEKASELFKNGKKEEAIPLLEENVAAGCTSSMVLLGVILADGSEEERTRSIALFKQAGEGGDSSGIRNLAYCYAIGLNIGKDKAEGARLYTKAAEMGNARAACNIGVMYDYGNGVDQDFDKAFYWFEKSAEGGCSRGMTNLGEYYAEGKGTVKNIPLAIEMFERSGSPRALFRLHQLYRDDPGFKNDEKANHYLKLSAEKGYTKGMVEYGESMENYDKETAVYYYNKATVKGNQAAIDNLVRLGLPVPESKRKRK